MYRETEAAKAALLELRRTLRALCAWYFRPVDWTNLKQEQEDACSRSK